MLEVGTIINFTREKYNDGLWQGKIVDKRSDGRYSVECIDGNITSYFAVSEEEIQEVLKQGKAPDPVKKSSGRVAQLETSIRKHQDKINYLKTTLSGATPAEIVKINKLIAAEERVIAQRRDQIKEFQ